MKRHIEERVNQVADYILIHDETIRKTAKIFGLSKSTVHHDISERLEVLNPAKAYRVQKILDKHFDQKHINGGIVTKNKYRRETAI